MNGYMCIPMLALGQTRGPPPQLMTPLVLQPQQDWAHSEGTRGQGGENRASQPWPGAESRAQLFFVPSVGQPAPGPLLIIPSGRPSADAPPHPRWQYQLLWEKEAWREPTKTGSLGVEGARKGI